jgi:hypothetical protein
MAVEPEDDELLLENQQDEGDKPEDQQDEEGEQGSPKPGDEGDEELEVFIGDEAAPASGASDSSVIRTLRERNRELTRRLGQVEAPKPVEIGPRPTLEECEWDEDRHAEAVEEWVTRKRAATQAETEQQRSQREANEDFARDRQAFETTRQSLKVTGREDATAAVEATLDPIQQAVLTKAGKDAALLEQGIGRNPDLLAEIASIKDPIKLALRLGELKGKIQMAPRRKAPEPEQIESGTAAVKQGMDKTLERLEAEAARNGGDRSKIIAYKAQQKSKAKS